MIDLNRKLTIILTITMAGLMVGTGLVAAASPPWWVTDVAVGAGAAIGSIGGPVGAISGAIAGASLVYLLYNYGGTSSNSPTSTAQYFSYANSVIHATANGLQTLNSQLGTEANLQTTSYYYFAQSMEAIAPHYLNQSSLNESYVGWTSGMYAAADNISRSSIYPLNNMFFTLYSWTVANSMGANHILHAASTPTLIGNEVQTGNYFFIIPSTSFYMIENTSLNLISVTGQSYWLNKTLPTTHAGMMVNLFGAGTNQDLYGIANTSVPQIVTASALNIPEGIYRIASVTTQPRTDWGNYAGTAFANRMPTITDGIVTDAIQLTAQGAYTSSLVWSTFMTTYGNAVNYWVSGILQASVNTLTSIAWPDSNAGAYTYNLTGAVSAESTGDLANVNTIISGTGTILSNAYASAQAFYNNLLALGYTNIAQIPASALELFPSSFVPTAMLNGTFNSTELQALYVAYLLQLKQWLSNKTPHLGQNMTVDNTTFTNGFVQLYGNLTMTNSSGKFYYNNTYFLPLINLGTWNYKVHTWTNITNGTPDPNWLITSGSDAGTLLNIQSATFYTLGISVNGTAVTSYTIKPVTIQYILPHTTSIGVFKSGGFLNLNNTFLGLAEWEWMLVGIIILLGISVVYSRDKRQE